MNKYWIILACLIFFNCNNKASSPANEKPSYENVNNDFTRYVDTLHKDLNKAEQATQQMNKKVAEQEENVRKFNEATDDKSK